MFRNGLLDAPFLTDLNDDEDHEGDDQEGYHGSDEVPDAEGSEFDKLPLNAGHSQLDYRHDQVINQCFCR